MRITLTILFLISTMAVFGQTRPELDPRLYEVYDSTYLSRLQNELPTLIYRLNFYLDHAFYITDYPAEKGSPADLPSVEIEDTSKVNILLLEKEQILIRDFDKQSYYRINQTDQVLVFHSGKKFVEMFNEYMKEHASE